MAFHTFFSLLPLLALTGWVAHRLALGHDGLLEPFAALAPVSVAAVADAEFMRLGAKTGAVLAPLSIGSFLWLASGGMNTAMAAFEQVFDAAPRSFLRRRLLALGFVVVAVVVLAASTASALLGIWVGGLVAQVMAVAMPLGALWLLAAGFFRYATRRREGGARSGFRGALVTLVLWLVVSAAFTRYVAEIANYSRFYGGLTAVVVLLVWLWLMCFALLVGGAVNAALERRAQSAVESAAQRVNPPA
jgi:membrane protein